MNSRLVKPLILIFMLVPLGPLAIDIYLPSFPQMASTFQVPNSSIQLTISIYMVFLGAGQLVAGPLSDRYGRKFSAVSGLAVYATGSLLAAFAPDLMLLYIARALQGLGAASCSVTSMAWIRDHFSGAVAGRWLSYMSGATGAIPMVAPLLGSLLAQWWGWPASFLLLAIVAGVLLISSLLILGNEQHRFITMETEQLPCNTRDVLSNGQFWLYSLTNAVSMGGLLVYISTAPVAAMADGGLSQYSFSLLFGIIGLCQLVFSVLAPIVVKWLGQRKAVVAGLITGITGGAGLLFVPNSHPGYFFAMAALGATGFSIVTGTLTALSLEAFQHCSGLASSIHGFLRMLGGAAIAAVITALPGSSFEHFAIAYLLLGIPLLSVIRDSGRQQPSLP
ncbi:multidrug effflux MFS transporter [Endozoicomonadaceae bacterium StTr2]